jgi:hypothetical protein
MIFCEFVRVFKSDSPKLPLIYGIGEFACRRQPVLPFQMANVVPIEDGSIQNPNAFGGHGLELCAFALAFFLNKIHLKIKSSHRPKLYYLIDIGKLGKQNCVLWDGAM